MTDLLRVDWSQIPAPTDDGAADHLTGAEIYSISLPATVGDAVDLAALEGRTVVYAYPMTGHPDRALPDGWDMLPGARGCTPQACCFRDHLAELKAQGIARVFGLSTQTTTDQCEAATRLHLPFLLLSDSNLDFAAKMRLPTFEVAGMTLLCRLTMIVDNGVVTKVFYPVFPPDKSAQAVLMWLTKSQHQSEPNQP